MALPGKKRVQSSDRVVPYPCDGDVLCPRDRIQEVRKRNFPGGSGGAGGGKVTESSSFFFFSIYFY